MGTSERDIKKYLKVGDNFENVRQLQNYKLTFQKGNYFFVEEADCRDNIKNQRQKIKNKFDPFDCGHLLAVELIKYLNICDMCKKELVVNEYNLFPQFPRANRNEKENIGQARFENWLMSYIKTNKNDSIYYEVEKIYRDDCSKNGIPIGTRLLARKNDAQNDKNLEWKPDEKLKLPFHVFIPNYQVKSDNIEGFKDKYCVENLEKAKIDIYHDASSVLK